MEGRPYKSNLWELMKAGFGTHVEDDLSSLFCSQLIAECFKRMNVIPRSIPSSNFLPSHFDEKDVQSANEIDRLLSGKLSKTIFIPKNIVPPLLLLSSSPLFFPSLLPPLFFTLLHHVFLLTRGWLSIM